MKPVLRWARAELCAQGSSSYLAVSLETTNSIAVEPAFSAPSLKRANCRLRLLGQCDLDAPGKNGKFFLTHLMSNSQVLGKL